MYKEYFDGAVFEDLHRTGVGVIIRNEQGLLIAAMSQKGRLVMESFVAELEASKPFGLLVMLAYRGDEF